MSTLTDEQEKAVREYEAASREVSKSLTTNTGGKKAEVVYGDAYQRLVALGLARQLKDRYRP